ncbi:MAG: BamA/TamA family outer membrane protein [Cyclobacteriaceae bacterium]|nr:BamA/TamA family outer membrane protein [Cyclobacteriaceae bacterium]
MITTLIVGCSTTKSLKKEEVLYRGERIKFEKKSYPTSWKINNSSEKFADVYWKLWDTPNGALLGMPVTIFIPFRLFIYHQFYNEKSTGFNYWIRQNFGEAPKTIQQVDPANKLKKGVSIFEEYGHFGTTGHYKLIHNKKHNKAYLRYFFNITKAYKYRSVKFGEDIKQPLLKTKVNTFSQSSILQPSREFNLYKIRAEKSRLANNLQNSGYYFLTDKDLLISADTTIGNKKLDLKIEVDDKLPSMFYKQQSVNNIRIKIDSITQPNHPNKFYKWGFGKLKSHVLDSVIDIKSQHTYSLSATQRTNFLLSELGIFSTPRIDYEVDESDSVAINPMITLNTLDATKFGFNIKGNYKNTGYVGPSIGLSFRQLNLFHGAENLSINADMYYDFPFGTFKDRVSDSYGASIRSTVTAPLIRPPFKFINHTYSLLKQFYNLNLEYNVRKNYFDLTILNATYGWTWKSKPNVTHTAGLIDVTLSSIKNPTQKFDDLAASNPLLAVTLVDQFLIGSYYKINYTRPATTYNPWGLNYTGKVDFSGNAINLLNGIFTNTPNGERKFLGVDYAQFTRITSTTVVNWHISKTHRLVFRNIMGIGFTSGNSKYLPFIKQYFIGGTNSLRPFSARTIGPGRFLQLDESEVNQVGDIKLEFNVEYRMPLLWKLNLAIFADMGNIWLLKPDPSRPEGEIKWNKILQDTYITSGVGLRLDVDYFVLRLDVAAIIHIPIVAEGSRWVWQYKTLIWAPVIGIGYPF